MVEGRLPKNKDEIALSKYISSTFLYYGIVDANDNFHKVNSYGDIVGKHILLSVDGEVYKKKICGVIDTGFNIEKYYPLLHKENKDNNMKSYINSLSESLSYASNSVHQSIFIDNNFINFHLNVVYTSYNYDVGEVNGDVITWDNNECFEKSVSYSIVKDKKVKFGFDFNNLKENEILLSKETLISYYKHYNKELINYTNSDTELPDETLLNFIADGVFINLSIMKYSEDYYNNEIISTKEYKIVGFFEYNDNDYSFDIRLPQIAYSDSIFNEKLYSEKNIKGFYSEISGIKKVDYSFVEYVDASTNYFISAEYSEIVDSLFGEIYYIKKVGLYTGFIFGLSAFAMMFNYIANTVYSNKKNIGILRAMSVNNLNVYFIFLVEVLFICIVSVLISIIISLIIVQYLNSYIIDIFKIPIYIILIKAYQPFLLIAISIAISIIASLIPILNILFKKPIEIIRDIK